MRLLVTSVRGLIRQQGVLLGLIVFMTGVYTLQRWLPFDWYRPFMTIPAKVTEGWQHLISGKLGIADLEAFGTTISYAFLHGDFGHLLGNMVFFWIFGALVSELLGWRWLLATVLFTAVAAAATHIGMNREEWTPMLGASGVVSGFMGAYLGLAVRWQLPDPHVWPMARPIPPAHLALLALFFVALDYREILLGAADRIAYGAHAGGFTAGLFLTSFVTPRPRQAHGRR